MSVRLAAAFLQALRTAVWHSFLEEFEILRESHKTQAYRDLLQRRKYRYNRLKFDLLDWKGSKPIAR